MSPNRLLLGLALMVITYTTSIFAQETTDTSVNSTPTVDSPTPSATVDAWWKKPAGPAYQVLIYSFADSNGDGMGDLNGLTNKLDYLNDGNPTPSNGRTFTDLDVSALWLSPISPARSYHGYDVVDYYGIDRRLGTMEDFERFIGEAHKRGIKVILDLVFNHTSTSHPWFQGYQNDPTGPYKDFYVTKVPGTNYGTGGMGRFYKVRSGPDTNREYFAAFWDGMPDLNSANPVVLDELKKVLTFWLSKGVDGFRFDAVKHSFDPNEYPSGSPTLNMNRDFWSSLVKHAQSIKPDVFTIGEVLSGNVSEVSAWSAVYSSLFDFPTAEEIIKAGKAQGSSTFAMRYRNNNLSYLRNNPDFTPSTLISNHDKDRGLSQILPSVSGDMVAGLQRAKLMATLTHTVGGLPWIYYAEELGMEGRRYSNDDVGRRMAMPWTTVPTPVTPVWDKRTGKTESSLNTGLQAVERQARTTTSILWHYRRLSDLRANSMAIREGLTFDARDNEFVAANPNLIAYYRTTATETILVIHNISDRDARVSLAGRTPVTTIWTTRDGWIARPARANATLSIAKYASAVFKLPVETNATLVAR